MKMSIKERKTALIKSIEKMDEKRFVQVERLLEQLQGDDQILELVRRALSSEKDISSGNVISLDDAEKLLDQHIFE